LKPRQRIVTKLPLAELWDESGPLAGDRLRTLDQSNLAELLRTAPVRFVVADCGLELRWIPTEQRVEFWKAVQLQIADPSRPMYLKQFPNETAYIASEWRGRSGEQLILLEKHH
jgi:hypothetical protein